MDMVKFDKSDFVGIDWKDEGSHDQEDRRSKSLVQQLLSTDRAQTRRRLKRPNPHFSAARNEEEENKRRKRVTGTKVLFPQYETRVGRSDRSAGALAQRVQDLLSAIK